MPKPCPCGPSAAYRDCCEPLHAGSPAQSAEALMRSRYSAYALNDVEYIKRSWHRSTRPPHIAPQEQTRWLGLSIKAVHYLSDSEATVEFIARFREGGGRARRLHELSRFVMEGGHWYYLDGRIIE